MEATGAKPKRASTRKPAAAKSTAAEVRDRDRTQLAAKPKRASTRKPAAAKATTDPAVSQAAADGDTPAAKPKRASTRKPAAATAADTDVPAADAEAEAGLHPQAGRRGSRLTVVDRARTRGHPAALAAIGAMVLSPSRAPHAVLLSGPAGVGKTTLALDLAAGLLCTAPEPSERPCRACRGCRMVAPAAIPTCTDSGRTAPGRQIVIGGRTPRSAGSAT